MLELARYSHLTARDFEGFEFPGLSEHEVESLHFGNSALEHASGVHLVT